uniref:Si:ch73-147o17.1 n=1 Tax=Sinocyclocheilus rhinocerous TaxID=307959 RepID=A0A673HPA1_9TELE
MGMCLPCLSGAEDDVVITPDPVSTGTYLFIKLCKLLRYIITYRGIKNPEALERKKKKQEETEKQTMNSVPSEGGGLKVHTVFTFSTNRGQIGVLLLLLLFI